MNEVVVAGLDMVFSDIALTHFHVGRLHVSEKSQVDVRCDNRSARADALSEVACYRSGPGTNFETLPPRAHPDGVEAAKCLQVSYTFDKPQTGELFIVRRI